MDLEVALEVNNAPVPGENAAAQAVNDERLRAEAMQFLTKFKFCFAVLGLFLLKFIFDNIIPCSLILCIMYGLLRIRNGLDMQLSLKKKSSCLTLFNLLVVSVFLIFTIVQFSNAFGTPDKLISRLLFMYGFEKPSHPITFLNTIWSCVIVDGIVQAGLTAMKLLVCLLLGSNTMKCKQMKLAFSFGESFLFSRRMFFF